MRTIRRLEAGSIRRPHPRSLRLLADALELGDAERAVLAAARDERARPMPRVARQLPADVAGFVGRTQHLRQMDALITDGTQTAAVVLVVAGTAGVGKTALAVHWAHRVTVGFPDGQLFVNLRGFDPSGTPMSSAEAVRGFLDALDVPPERIPADLQAQAALYRSLLAGKRVLVVLDNARDVDQIRPLLPGAPGCVAVVTSRNQLAGLITTSGARPLTVDLLSAPEARELLARRIGADRTVAEPEATDEIVARCARLPLALAIVATRAATHPSFPLATLAGELRESRGSLDTFTGEGAADDVRAVFSWSYGALRAGGARLFRLLGLHPGPDIATPAAASLAGVTTARVRPLLAELTRAHLLTEHAPGRFALHDLLRAYARELALALDGEADRRAAAHRMLDHYLHSTHDAAVLLDRHQDPITLAPLHPGTTPEHPVDDGEALAWFAAERAVLLAAVDHAAAFGFDAHAWRLAWMLATFLERRGHWHDQVRAGRTALAAACRLADQSGQASTRRSLAAAYTMLGRFDQARTHLQHALDVYRLAGDELGQAHVHHSLAYVWERQGCHAESLRHARQALALFQTTGHRAGEAHALNAVGWYHALLGEHKQALARCRDALARHQELGNRYGQAGAWDSLGYAHHHLGHHRQAIDCYQDALRLYRAVGERYNEADVLTHLGDTQRAAGNVDAACAAWRRALAILDELDHPDAERVRGRLGAADSVRSTEWPVNGLDQACHRADD